MPANPAKVKPWWFHTMNAEFAAEHYGFPDPSCGGEYVAPDGSRWAFDTGSTGWWELMNYSTLCVCRECPELVDDAKLKEFCTACLLVGCDKQIRT